MDRYCYRSGDCLRVGFGVSQASLVARVSRPGRMWTFVHKVATSRFPGTKASAATAETCKRYFQEAWAKREQDLWGVRVH